MYKVLSIVLACIVLVSGSLFAYEKHKHSKTKKQFFEKVGELEGTLKESEGLYSKRAIEISDLEDLLSEALTNNKEAKEKIKARDEDIAVITEASIRWKDKYFKIKGQETNVVYVPVDTIPDEELENVKLNCKACFDKFRLKVEFDQTQDILRVHGYTLTNPPEANLEVAWIKDLKLSLVLTKDDEDNFRIYLDSNNSSIESADLKLVIDPDVLKYKWYERISVSADLAFSNYSSIGGIKINYDIFENLYLGPSMFVVYDGLFFDKYYGFNIGWYIFR
jgi:hypothetical protein